MPEKQPEARELLQLVEYLAVLADAYPSPVNSTSLAHRLGKSKAAVTKVRERLLKVCDKTKMALDRAFVLRPDLDTVGVLLLVFAANGKHERFLKSRFITSLVGPAKVHAKLSATFPLYGQYFEEADTAFIVSKGLAALSSANPEALRSVARALSKPTNMMTSAAWLQGAQQVIGGVKLEVKDRTDLERVLSIRDKLFFLVREFLWKAMQDMQILKTMPEENCETYVTVYKHTIDFYLRRVFEALNEPIRKAAEEAGLAIGGSPQIGASVLAAPTRG